MITGLSSEVTSEQIREYFSGVGAIKMNQRTNKPMIWIFMNDQKKPRGDASITYEDANSARNAINYYNQKDFNGRVITVQYATYGQKPTVQPVLLSQKQGGGMNGGMMGGMMAGMSRMPMGGYAPPMSIPGADRPNDWVCGMCNNVNFHWRNECNRCKVARAEANAQPAPSGSVKAIAARGAGKPRQNVSATPTTALGMGVATTPGTGTGSLPQSAPGPERNVANRGSNRTNPY